MTESDKKLLTEFLGEGADWNSYKYERRTFDTWQDLGDLKEKLVELGRWDEFENYIWGKYYFEPSAIYKETWLNWLLNPARFCQLVADWRKENPWHHKR